MDYTDKIDFKVGNVNKLINLLIDKNKKLIIFVGSGISKLCGLPLWNELAEKLVDDFFEKNTNENKSLKRIAEKNPKVCLSLLEASCHDTNYLNDKIKEKLIINDENTAQKRIVASFKKMKASIVTTNADLLLDCCALSENYVYEYALDELNMQNEAIQEPSVLYLHGRITAGDTLVFTVGKYLKKYQNPIFKMNMEKLFSNKNYVFLFMGTSMNELELLQYMFDTQNEKFILETFNRNNFVLEDLYKNYYENNFNIKQISIDINEKDYEKQIDFLEKLSNEIYFSYNYNRESYEKIVDLIDKCVDNNFENIIDEIIHEKDILREDIIYDIFRIINLKKWSNDFYIKLKKIQEDLFNVPYTDNHKECSNLPIQKVIMKSIIADEVKNEEYSMFIYEYIKKIENFILEKYTNVDVNSNYDDFELIIGSYFKLLNKITNYNEENLLKIINILISNKFDSIDEAIFWLARLELDKELSYEIFKKIFESKIYSESLSQAYGLNIFINKNLEKTIRFKGLDMFNVIKKIITNANYRYYYFCSCLSEDIDSRDESIYEIYILKILINIIDNMKENDIRKIDMSNNKTFIERMINLYIIDRYFVLLKDSININLYNNIECFPSIVYIIKNNRNIINSDLDYKNKLINFIDELINNRKDNDSIKNLVLSLFEKDLKESEMDILTKIGSKKATYSSGLTNDYVSIKKMSLNEIIDMINEAWYVSLELEDKVREYFEDYQKLVEIMENTELFKKIKYQDIYSHILHRLYEKPFSNLELLKKFIKEVGFDLYNEYNCELCIKIIEINLLHEFPDYSSCILEKFYDEVINKVGFSNNDNCLSTQESPVYKCFKLLCKIHINKGDVLEYVKEKIKRSKESKNYVEIIKSLSSIYMKIYEKNDEILNYMNQIINEKNESININIYNYLYLNDYQYYVHSSALQLIKNDEFEKVFLKLDSQAKNFYSKMIFNNSKNFTDSFINNIIDNTTIDLTKDILKNYKENQYGSFDDLISKLDRINKNTNIEISVSGELLYFYFENYNNVKISSLYNKILERGKINIDWSEINKILIDLFNQNKNVLIYEILSPLSILYLNSCECYACHEFKKIIEEFEEMIPDDGTNESINLLREIKKIKGQIF